ncbi:MAG: beta-ketoacyl-ACP synthase II [Candidatus Sericytochromatia bacterium]
MTHRVVVTGLGAVTPLGNTVEAYWEGLKAGRSGIGCITQFDATNFSTRIAGEVKDFDVHAYVPDRKEARRLARFSQFAIAASKQAVADAKLDMEHLDTEEIGVYIGSGMSALGVIEEQNAVLASKGPDRVSPFTVPLMIPNMASGNVAIAIGARGPNVCAVTACASGSHAIGDAFRMLQHGEAEVMIAGGTESVITPLGIASFASAKTLSNRNDAPEKASRPFDAERDGFVMGEGAGVLVLETLEHAQKRGATIYAELVGYGLSADAFHMTAPAPEGEGAARAMRKALTAAGLKPEDVDYINAHGTSTALNDKLETQAVKAVFGPHAHKLAISSTKSMTGHLLGAAGGIEAVATVLALRDGVLPPTINLEHPDPECDLDYVPNQARTQPIEVAMSNNMGFGGHNASLVFKKFHK